MTLGLHDSTRRQRRRRFWKAIRWVFILSMIAAAGVFSYQGGSRLAREEVIRLEEEVDNFSESIKVLEQQNTALKAAMNDATVGREKIEQRYRKDVPAGQRKQFLSLIDKRLEEGVSPERLDFVISLAANERTCKMGPVTKRFLVRTPLYQGPGDSVSFANNTITVTAEGQSATDAAGNLEAWFDAAKPLTVFLVRLGGQRTKVSGLLPLHQALVIDETEYRFSVVRGEARGFVNVSAEGCRYP